MVENNRPGFMDMSHREMNERIRRVEERHHLYVHPEFPSSSSISDDSGTISEERYSIAPGEAMIYPTSFRSSVAHDRIRSPRLSESEIHNELHYFNGKLSNS
jgi:hypothetical protein